MLEQKIDLLIAALDRTTAALGGKATSAPAAGKPAEKTADKPAGKPAGKPGRPAASKITMEQLAEKASAFKEANGMPATRALFKEHGAEDGKIASVPKENWVGLEAAIDAALSGEGDEPAEDDEGL
jgi:hypothetical protein